MSLGKGQSEVALQTDLGTHVQLQANVNIGASFVGKLKTMHGAMVN